MNTGASATSMPCALDMTATSSDHQAAGRFSAMYGDTTSGPVESR
ncbi:hypothetical protein ACSVDM_16870 [Nocardia sp. JW2]|nr:hypothetical protein [Nocardia coubleae]